MKTVTLYIVIALTVGLLFLSPAVGFQKSESPISGGWHIAMTNARKQNSPSDNDLGATLSFLRILVMNKKKKSRRTILKPSVKIEGVTVTVKWQENGTQPYSR